MHGGNIAGDPAEEGCCNYCRTLRIALYVQVIQWNKLAQQVDSLVELVVMAIKRTFNADSDPDHRLTAGEEIMEVEALGKPEAAEEL